MHPAPERPKVNAYIEDVEEDQRVQNQTHALKANAAAAAERQSNRRSSRHNSEVDGRDHNKGEAGDEIGRQWHPLDADAGAVVDANPGQFRCQSRSVPAPRHSTVRWPRGASGSRGHRGRHAWSFSQRSELTD
jgi:hypothetical protein